MDLTGAESGSKHALEAQLRATIDVIPAYTWYANPSGGLTFVNERLSDYLGLPKDHPLRFGVDMGAEWDSHIPLLHPDDHEETRRIWSTCLRTGRAGEVSFRVRNAEGGYRWFLSRAEPLRSSDGTLLYWIGVNLEIEERKQAERRRAEEQREQLLFEQAARAQAEAAREQVGAVLSMLKRSEERYRAFVEHSSEGIWCFEAEPPLDTNLPEEEHIAEILGRSHLVECNDAMARMYGFPDARQLLGTPLREMLVASPENVQMLRAFIQSGYRLVDAESCEPDREGNPKYYLNNFVGVVENGYLVRAWGTQRDITERKRAEQTLRQSEAYLAEAQRLAHMGSWVWQVAGRDALHLSDEWYRIYGFDPKQGMPGWEERLQRVHPEDRGKWQGTIERSIRERSDYDVEFRILLPNGTIKWVHTVGHPVLSTAGELVQFVGSSMDVTERKTAEERIREQEVELRQMLDLAPQLVVVFGPNRERLFANRPVLDYLGVTLEAWRDTAERFWFFPNDWDRVESETGSAYSTGAPHEFETRLRNSDGSYRWFLMRLNPLYDDKGQVKRWYVASTDIDERKRAEERLQQENVALREEIDKASMFEEIVGTSPALKTVLSRISKVAPSDSTVLITGETGTGKELVARALHRRSDRASRAFVSVNCAAIPRDLIASELFGHEKGAFTGAAQQRLGRFELANGGTIFLDEVGELPPETQIALLRVLQEHEFERIGGSRRIRADVRVIAATNRDLQAAISGGSFRSDLFYRLNVFPMEIPSLRERREDIPLLVEYFIDRYARRAGKNIKHVSKKTFELMQSYLWPGNIRELQNVIERSVILCETEIFSIDEKWLPQQPNLATEPRHQSELPRRLLTQEKKMIEEALKESRGRVFGPTGAAAKLGIPRSTLESKIRSLKIDKNRFRTLSEI
jgi:formate hydrogenlyase transcriptional activator